MKFSIGILAWKSGKTLHNTLRSYQRNGLLELCDDITILFQEASEEDARLARRFGIPHIGLKENIGIGRGIEMLAKNAKYDHFLFLEHDWELVENKDKTERQLNEGLELLSKGFDVVKYRSRSKPGIPLYSSAYKGRELDYYDDWHKVTSPHLLESLHWLDPAEAFPDKITKRGAFFTTTSRWANWSNNPFLIHKNFYLEKLVPFSGEGVHFEKNIAPWWVQQQFKIAQGEGLFMHHDFVKYPEKNLITKAKQAIKRMIS